MLQVEFPLYSTFKLKISSVDDTLFRLLLLNGETANQQIRPRQIIHLFDCYYNSGSCWHERAHQFYREKWQRVESIQSLTQIASSRNHFHIQHSFDALFRLFINGENAKKQIRPRNAHFCWHTFSLSFGL